MAARLAQEFIEALHRLEQGGELDDKVRRFRAYFDPSALGEQATRARR